jgi:ribose 1,5-bisphosphokinase PhnN
MLPLVSQITPYSDELSVSDARVTELLKDHDAVIVWRYWNEAAPVCPPDACTVLASRIALRGRHGPGEVSLRKLRKPERVFFWREYLVVKG